jgi:hypothetical protein
MSSSKTTLVFKVFVEVMAKFHQNHDFDRKASLPRILGR